MKFKFETRQSDTGGADANQLRKHSNSEARLYDANALKFSAKAPIETPLRHSEGHTLGNLGKNYDAALWNSTRVHNRLFNDAARRSDIKD